MKKYKIIYADPPWRYARSKVQGAAEKHYPTMSIEELCALPVKEIADKDCILFLWATFPQLKEALQLIKAWGFTYKSVAFPAFGLAAWKQVQSARAFQISKTGAAMTTSINPRFAEQRPIGSLALTRPAFSLSSTIKH